MGHSHEHGHGHSHDHAGRVDDALRDSRAGIRAVKISLVVLIVTAALQIAIVVASGSVALLADTIHNFSDALTAIPLWIAFSLSRRSATRRYTYGLGRAEDLAGLFVVGVIALSAIVAAAEAVHRSRCPTSVGWPPRVWSDSSATNWSPCTASALGGASVRRPCEPTECMPAQMD